MIIATFWLVVTNIALGVFTVAFLLALLVVALAEIVQRRGNHGVIRGIGSGRMYVSESGLIGGVRRSDLGAIGRN